LLSRCEKSELKNLNKSLEQDHIQFKVYQNELSKIDASQSQTLQQCHDFIHLRFLSLISHSYLDKLHFVADQINSKKKFNPNCAKMISELKAEEKYFYKNAYKKCSEFAQKSDSTASMAEAQAYNDRVEQLLVSCDRLELTSLSESEFTGEQDSFKMLSELITKYENNPPKNYDECHHHKEIELLIKTKDVLGSRLYAIWRNVLENDGNYKSKELRRDCEDILKIYMSEKELFDDDRNMRCDELKGK